MTKLLVESPDGSERHLLDADVIDPAYAGWTMAPTQDFDALEVEIRKAELKAVVVGRLAEAFAAGFSPASGPLSGHTLQVRDQDDKTNWLTSQAAYAAAIEAGAGNLKAATFRTADNETIATTFSEGHQTLLDMAAWGRMLMARSWVLKDQIAGAADMAELEAIDPAAGWP